MFLRCPLIKTRRSSDSYTYNYVKPIEIFYMEYAYHGKKPLIKR